MRCGFGSERQFSLESVSKLLKADPDLVKVRDAKISRPLMLQLVVVSTRLRVYSSSMG